MKTAHSCLCASEWIRRAIEQGRSLERHFQMRLTYACEWIKGDKPKESRLSASGLARSLSVFVPSDDVIKLLAPLRLFKSVLNVSRETMMLVYQPLARSVTPQAEGWIQERVVFSNKRRKGGFVCFCV